MPTVLAAAGASAQATTIYLNRNETVKKVCHIIEKASEKGAQLIIFPEAFIPGYPDWVWLIPNSKGADLNKLYLKLVESAVSVPDDTTEKLCKSAKMAGINVVMGVNERNSETSNASLYNSILFITFRSVDHRIDISDIAKDGWGTTGALILVYVGNRRFWCCNDLFSQR